MIRKTEIERMLNKKCGICGFDFIKEHLIQCRKIQDIPENAASVILFAFPYKIKEEKPENISRYAAVPDYHPICKEHLDSFVQILKTAFPNNSFVSFVDNSPIPEVYAAAAAGLGVLGKNGLLITKEYGSFVFIGEIVTDLEIQAENKVENCIGCGKCEKACPVSLNKEKCLSAITQKKQDLTDTEIELIKKSGCIWGCDICSEVCPMNKSKKLSEDQCFIDGYRHTYIYNEDITHRAYAWRGESVIKRNCELGNRD